MHRLAWGFSYRGFVFAFGFRFFIRNDVLPWLYVLLQRGIIQSVKVDFIIPRRGGTLPLTAGAIEILLGAIPVRLGRTHFKLYCWALGRLFFIIGQGLPIFRINARCSFFGITANREKGSFT